MLHNEINKHIAAAMKSRDADRLYVLKMIKAKFLEFQTSKGFNEADFNDAVYHDTLWKLVRDENYDGSLTSLMKALRTAQDEYEKFLGL